MNINSYCNVVGKTDVGCKRRANEDWLDHFECHNGLVAVVCDGMGGHVGGEVASHLAVETIRKFLEENYFDDPRDAIVEACDAANEAIIDRTRQKPELSGMGATCVMLIVRDGKVYYGSVGDSRIYLVRSKRITQLTKDQSYVQMLVDMGEITPGQAEHHPRKNEITNALGLDDMEHATVAPAPVDPQAGDCFILCSDGLSGMVPDSDILKIAADQQRRSQHERVDALIALAKENGGLDNVTCQIVEFAVTPSEILSDNGKKKKIALFANIPLVALVIVAAVLLFSGKSESSGSSDRKDAPVAEVTPPGVTDMPRVINNPDTIRYVENKPFMAIRENHDYNSLEIEVTFDEDNKRTVIVRHPVKIGDIKISPERYIRTDIADRKMTVALDSIHEMLDCVSLKFVHADSTYIYKFPVRHAGAGNSADAVKDQPLNAPVKVPIDDKAPTPPGINREKGS